MITYITTVLLQELRLLISASLVSNYVYAIAINDRANQALLSSKGFLLPNPETEGDLDYPVLDTMHWFREPLADMLDVTEGTSAKKMRLNINGDQVATTAPKARIYEVANIAKKLRKDVENGTKNFFSDSVIVGGLEGNGTNEFTLLGMRAKDGITKGLISKGNSKLSEKEQLQYLIEHTYLTVAEQSKWKNALIQAGVMSDRSLVDLGYFKANEGQEFLPENSGVMDDKQMKADFIKGQVNQHAQLSKQVIDTWEKQLKLWGEDVKFNNLRELAKHVEKANIPYSKVRASKILIGELAYKEGAEVEVKGKKDPVVMAKVKDILVEMDSIWSNPAEASDFTDGLLRKYKADLERIGYTKDVVSKKSMDTLGKRYSTNNETTLFDNLTTSYFYQSNLLSNATMDLMMGSRYQFKGDMKNVSKNPEFIEATKNLDKTKRAKYAKEISIARALDDLFGAQAKRNASLGSGHQHPRLAGENENGKYLGKKSNTAVIDDPNLVVNLLGDLNEKIKQDIYDAAMFAHPLYFLRLNNSLGNFMSGYTTKGGPIKDISNEVDEKTGVFRFQKKATFNMFDYEMLQNGSEELHTLFNKMNSAIKFKGKLEFEGEVFDAKNMKELFEHFGGYEADGKDGEPTSWDKVLDVLAVNPANRDAYVEKVGFVSGEKSGNRAVNTDGVWRGNEILKHTPFDNTHHGVILNADHNPDTTASGNIDEEMEDNMVSLMTQVISAVAFEGRSSDKAAEINEALLSLSETGLEKINHSIYSNAVQTLKDWVKSPRRYTVRR